jgi:hypothetical protein
MKKIIILFVAEVGVKVSEYPLISVKVAVLNVASAVGLT